MKFKVLDSYPILPVYLIMQVQVKTEKSSC